MKLGDRSEWEIARLWKSPTYIYTSIYSSLSNPPPYPSNLIKNGYCTYESVFSAFSLTLAIGEALLVINNGFFFSFLSFSRWGGRGEHLKGFAFGDWNG